MKTNTRRSNFRQRCRLDLSGTVLLSTSVSSDLPLIQTFTSNQGTPYKDTVLQHIPCVVLTSLTVLFLKDWDITFKRKTIILVGGRTKPDFPLDIFFELYNPEDSGTFGGMSGQNNSSYRYLMSTKDPNLFQF